MENTNRYAGFWIRFLAYIIDGIVVGIAGGIVGAIFGAVLGAMGTDLKVISSIARLLGIVISWMYFALMESSANQGTVGKMALGIKVIDLNGERISFGKATGRYFGKILSALIILIGFIMAGFTAKKQALHDMIAGTLVVRK